MFKAVHERLKTKDRVICIGMQIEPRYVICEEQPELTITCSRVLILHSFGSHSDCYSNLIKEIQLGFYMKLEDYRKEALQAIGIACQSCHD